MVWYSVVWPGAMHCRVALSGAMRAKVGQFEWWGVLC